MINAVMGIICMKQEEIDLFQLSLLGIAAVGGGGLLRKHAMMADKT